MRKALGLAVCLILIVSLAVPVSAAAGVTGGTFTAAVSQEGSCQVTLDLQIHLEGGTDELVFPLPSSARSITLNGNPARTSRSGDVLNVKLSSVLGNVTGDFTLRIQYTLPGVVAYGEENKYLLTLPLLSGFNYSIENLKFSILLPGEITARPDFISGYYQQTIESSINYEIQGATLSGSVDTELKDREILTMTLVVPGDQFPQTKNTQWQAGWAELMMVVLTVLALVYWIVFLRSAPFLSRRSTLPPDGCTAGELSGLFTGMGGDLTMMVFSWAQLGYILIQVTDTGRVILHKRMEMGNERGAEEVRLFRALFGKRRFVDGTGYHYAGLCCKAASDPGNVRFLYKRSSGNPRVFRLLCMLVGLLGGVSLGRTVAGDAILGILLIMILAVLGAVSAWLMQDWVRGLHLRNRQSLLLGLGLALVWCILGLLAGIPAVTAGMAGVQLLCGLATVYGGRRTAVGRQTISQVLGLRRYLKRLSPQEAQGLIRRDPDYFFAMLPYAMALGVEKPFAKSFRGRPFPPCAYLTTGGYHRMTALEWARLMGQTAASLDAQYKRLFLERLLGK